MNAFVVDAEVDGTGVVSVVALVIGLAASGDRGSHEAFAVGADIPLGAGVQRFTAVRSGAVCTPDAFVAEIPGAGVSVVTEGRVRGKAISQQAGVFEGAWIAVIAGIGVQTVHTAIDRMTRVRGADVVVRAVADGTGHAEPSRALISFCTGVSIVTEERVLQMDASDAGEAGVVGAEISIVAGDGKSGVAVASQTTISLGARVSVFTGDFIDDDGGASRFGIAGIDRALVAIVALLLSTSPARSLDTAVHQCAGISIVAEVLGRRMDAADLGGTGIIGASIAVIAEEGVSEASGDAALVVLGAGIPIITALSWAQGGDASDRWIAPVDGALIPIITGNQPFSETGPI